MREVHGNRIEGLRLGLRNDHHLRPFHGVRDTLSCITAWSLTDRTARWQIEVAAPDPVADLAVVGG